MPPPADAELRELATRREAIAQLDRRRSELRLQMDASETELEALRRGGESDVAIAAAQQQVAAAAAEIRQLSEQRGQLVAELRELASGVVGRLDESQAVTALDGRVPVAMLPVRIETRFAPDLRSLAIRVYPDQIHLDAHEPELTDSERDAAHAYWELRWPALDDETVAATAWDTVAGRFPPGRARYIVDASRPANIDLAPDVAPEFPELPNRPSSWTRAIEATALPERWVAVGYQNGDGGKPVEVFRRWSSHVPDRLAAGPSPAIEDEPPEPDPASDTPAVQEQLLWAFDPAAAEQAGMLLRVTDQDLAPGRKLADGLSRLVVLGVDWTLDPESAAESLEQLLHGHAATGDLAFVAPGTPTNNTGGGASGFSTAPSQQRSEWAPPLSGTDPDAAAEAAAGRLAAALGIAGEVLAPVPGASARHHRWSSALVDALWEATGGYYLSDMLEPLGDDALSASVREHAAKHLHASGPLPSVRVGPQPYGVLPVVSSAGYRPAPDSRAEPAISQVAGVMRSLWEPLTGRLPHLGRTTTRDVDATMLDLLQRTPVPWRLRWREMTPPSYWSSSSWMIHLRNYQAPLIFTLMDLLGVAPTHPVRVQYLSATKDSHALGVPLVIKGEEGTAYLSEIVALARGGSDGRRDLNLRQNSIALLEALLAFAACQELDKAATGVLVNHVEAEVAEASGLTRRGVRTPDLVRVENGNGSSASPFKFASARDLSRTKVPGTDVPLHDAVAERFQVRPLPEIVRDRGDAAHGLARCLASIATLNGAPPDEVEWAFRGVLDLYSSRLDAWMTSLAHSRLARHRADRPDGVHIGCYGWVEDLATPRGDAAESLGHILAPSLAHATAAAILRSGRESHGDSGAFDIDMNSARVREATGLLEGVAGGQPIAALVGYQVERRMRDAGLADLTVALRLEAPLQTRDEERDEPLESVAARDVVDGVQLLRLFDGDEWAAIVTRLGINNERRNRLEDVLRSVAASYDAVADVLFAETLHQTATGNLERASAAAGALDRQELPVQPEVVQTPRSGAVITNRVLVQMGETTADSRWPARGPRGSVEPRLDRWLGSLLGAPEQLTVSANLIRAAAGNSGAPEIVDLGSVSAADLGLSPLALVLAAERPAADRPSELQARVVAQFAEQVPDPRESDRIELGDVSLLQTLAEWSSRLASGSRPLEPSDFAASSQVDASPTGEVDLADLRQRADAAIQALRAAIDTLRDSGGTAAQLRKSLASVSELAGPDALTAPIVDETDQAAALQTQVDEVRARLEDLLTRAEAEMSLPDDPDADPAERPIAVVHLVLGAQQPVLPIFALADPGEIAASLADRDALLDGDETAPISWLQRAALVRPELDPLSGLLTHAEASGADIAASVEVAQLPHRPGARWAELPFGDEGPPPSGTISLVLVADDGFDPARPLAGLAIDSWAEAIPEPTHTAALAFHYDAPGARPPQSVVLAVHPLPDPEHWELDILLDTVNETVNLCHLRALSLKEIEAFSGLLPALYLPNNYTRDVPSVSFKGLVEAAAASDLLTKATAAGVAGKE